MTRSFLNVPLLRKRLERHPCLVAETNPVLNGASGASGSAERVAAALGQYCFLPRRIVELLTLGANRTGQAWPKVTEELRRNLREELGELTYGLPHFRILKTCLKRELGMDLDRVEQGPASATFLGELAGRLEAGTLAQASGIVAAIEDSATPELEVVARVIDCYAELSGRPEVPIDLAALRAKDRLEEIWQRVSKGFTLEDFFALHILYFEAGHSDGLANAISPYLTSAEPYEDFLGSYEETLTEMDRWWEAMASETALN